MTRPDDGFQFPRPIRQFRATTPDGLSIAVQEWGNPDGPEILFIHGYLQSHLSWAFQVDSDLATRFRMVTYDLRGHGGSAQPEDAEFYRDPQRWSDELASVIAMAALRRPVLVAWSYAGRVVADYLARRTASGIAGINFVASRIRAERRFSGPRHPDNQAMMVSDDFATRLEGTYRFLLDCAVTWDPAVLAKTMGVSMAVPPVIRAALQGRGFDADMLFAALPVPLLVTHGDADRIVSLAAAQHTRDTCPAAQFSLYEGVGHAPFMEAAARFNAELAAFVQRCADQPG